MIFFFHRDKIPQTLQCINATTRSCTKDVKDKVEISFNFVWNLVKDQCVHGPTTPVPKCDTLSSRQCITKLYTLIDEADDFQSACK